jgi:hypothetical protein
MPTALSVSQQAGTVLEARDLPGVARAEFEITEGILVGNFFRALSILRGRFRQRLLVTVLICAWRDAMFPMAHTVTSRQRSTSVAFGAKRILIKPRLQKADL